MTSEHSAVAVSVPASLVLHSAALLTMSVADQAWEPPTILGDER